MEKWKYGKMEIWKNGNKEKWKQAGAELCQAQGRFGLNQFGIGFMS